MNKIMAIITLCALSACGFKGDLYLPKENDNAQFGVIQTGIDFKRPNAQSSSTEKNTHENH